MSLPGGGWTSIEGTQQTKGAPISRRRKALAPPAAQRFPMSQRLPLLGDFEIGVPHFVRVCSMLKRLEYIAELERRPGEYGVPGNPSEKPSSLTSNDEAANRTTAYPARPPTKRCSIAMTTPFSVIALEI